MSKISFRYVFILLSISVSSMCYAQEVDYSIREIKVQGNLQSYYDEDTRREVLDSLVLGQFIFLNLAEVLRNQGGILISSYGSKGSLAGIKIRGTGDNHTRFLWNGIPVNSLTTGTMDASLIPAGFMQNVAITKGASGVLAGNSSFGGAIYLDNSPEWNKKYSFSLISEVGSFGYRALMPSVLVSSKNIQYKASFQVLKSDNNFLFDDTYKSGSPEVRQINDSLAQWGIIQNLFIRLRGNTQIDMGMWLQEKNKDIPPVMGSYQIAPANQADRSLKSYLKLTKIFRDSRLLVQLGYLNDSLHYSKLNPASENSYMIDSHIATSSLFSRSEWRWFINPKFTLDIGAHTEHPRAVVDSYGMVQKENRASLISAAKYRNGSWIANIGLRKEFNQYNPPKPLASFGVSWKSKNKENLIRGNISNKFRIPSFNERYWQPGGNPDLRPEYGWGGELGWRWERNFSGDFVNQLEPVIFFQKIRDWIQWVPSAEYWFPVNQDLMISRGVELNGSTSMKSGKWNSKLTYKYSYTDARQADSDDSENYSNVIYIPLHQVFIGGSTQLRNFSAGLNYQFLNSRFTTIDKNHIYQLDPIHLVSLNAAIKIQLKQFQLEIYSRIDNLFSYQYQMIRSYATPGISGVIGVKINIVKPLNTDRNEN